MFASARRSQPVKAASPPGVDDPWGELMAAAQGGNGGAYQRLLIEVDVWLRRYYAHRLPPAIVEDAAQDTLLTIHARRHTYEPGRPFKAWLAGIARYKWIDRLRALAREPAVSLEDDVAEDLAVDDHGVAVTSAILLQELMRRLKPAQAEVIQMVKLQGFSVEEASIRTGQSVSLVKVNIHRGLARLSAIVEGQTS